MIFGHGVLIVEDLEIITSRPEQLARLFEADAVFTLVGAVLRVVPRNFQMVTV